MTNIDPTTIPDAAEVYRLFRLWQDAAKALRDSRPDVSVQPELGSARWLYEAHEGEVVSLTCENTDTVAGEIVDYTDDAVIVEIGDDEWTEIRIDAIIAIQVPMFG